MRIGDKIKFYCRGRVCSGTITGKHGNAEFFSVKTDDGKTVYLWAEDMVQI